MRTHKWAPLSWGARWRNNTCRSRSAACQRSSGSSTSSKGIREPCGRQTALEKWQAKGERDREGCSGLKGLWHSRMHVLGTGTWKCWKFEEGMAADRAGSDSNTVGFAL